MDSKFNLFTVKYFTVIPLPPTQFVIFVAHFLSCGSCVASTTENTSAHSCTGIRFTIKHLKTDNELIMPTLRPATPKDFEQIWSIFHAVVAKGDTYTYARDTSKEDAYQLWMEMPRSSFVAIEDGVIVGTYFIKTNQGGGGDHVCNCGYMVAPSARGRGLAALMCEHSLAMAKEMGYRAMQFNFVISSNESAVHLWSKLGFATVGRLPLAFRHPQLGFVDALVMFKSLV